MTPPTQDLAFPAARREDLTELLEFVDAECARARLPEAIGFSLRLATEEAFMNILNHGYEGRPGPVRVSLDRGRDRVTVTLADEAPAFDPAGAPPPDLETDLEQRTEGGLGLHLIREMMDEVDHRTTADGNVLIMTKYLGEADGD